MKLTARQIKTLDEIYSDRESSDHTLAIACNYHSNRFSELKKKEKDLWIELFEENDLDKNKNYGVKSIDGAMMIVEKEHD